MRQGKRELRISQERFEMHAELALMLYARLNEAERSVAELTQVKHNNFPIVEGVAEAYEIQDRQDEKAELLVRIRELGEDLKAEGMPAGVWVEYRRKDQPVVKVRLQVDSNNGRATLLYHEGGMGKKNA